MRWSDQPSSPAARLKSPSVPNGPGFGGRPRGSARGTISSPVTLLGLNFPQAHFPEPMEGHSIFCGFMGPNMRIFGDCKDHSSGHIYLRLKSSRLSCLDNSSKARMTGSAEERDVTSGGRMTYDPTLRTPRHTTTFRTLWTRDMLPNLILRRKQPRDSPNS